MLSEKKTHMKYSQLKNLLRENLSKILKDAGLKQEGIMVKYTYPAIFEKEQDGGYSIYFPDIAGCYTQAEDAAEGIENAGDALCLMLYELEKQGRPIPKPGNIKDIEVNDGGFVTQVACDTRLYINYFESKGVKIDAANHSAREAYVF
jgi:predicted RNase H-like HicB family nuclease